MNKILKLVCALIVVLGTALTVYAAPAPVKASSPYTTAVCKADDTEYVANSTVVVTPQFYGDDPEQRSADVSTEGTVKPKDESIVDVPPGYMGINPILFYNNTMFFDAGWKYNTGSSPILTQSHQTTFLTVSKPGFGEELVSSRSMFRLYAGDQYDTYWAAMSPVLDVVTIVDEAMPDTNTSSGTLDPKDYFEVNELGLTYGEGVYDVMPDLIAAFGLNGVHGYVYQTDLINAGAKKTLDDPVLDPPASIPLYASDGVTVIGEFPIGPRPDNLYGTQWSE